MSDEADNQMLTEQKTLDALYLKIASSMGVKGMNVEKLKKYLEENEENSAVCKQIINQKNPVDFFFALQTGSSGQDTCLVKLEMVSSKDIKRKCFIFLKLFKESLNTTNISRLIFFEINKNPIQLLYSLFQEIYVPILQNQKNQKNWNELLSKDLMEKLNGYVAQTYLTMGKIQGKTFLPLPSEKMIHSRDVSDKEKSNIFESLLIIWTKQIKKVLDTEPEQILKSKAHPDPLQELNFWKKKAENLNSISLQLKNQNFKFIIDFLNNSKSTFINQFERLQNEVEEAQRESNENYYYLNTLESQFSKLIDPNSDFVQLPDVFFPIMHVIMLIYNESTYYKSPSRIVLLIREICNAIIAKASDYIPSEAIIAMMQSKDEIEAVCDKLQITIDVCTKFKDTYFEYKAKNKEKWKFPHNALFMHLDNYLERCYDILHITSTIQQFNKLEICKFGGTKGRFLTDSLHSIYNEFTVCTKIFQGLSYDIVDFHAKKFDEDFCEFRNKIKELERRLASIITQSFDDVDTLIDKFKLFESFENLLKRPIIQYEVERKYMVLIEMYKTDLKAVQVIFLENRALIDKNDENAPIFNNLPPIAGALTWATSLQNRINEPFFRLLKIDQELKEKDEFKEMEKMYELMKKMLEDFKSAKTLAWQKEIEETTEEKLNNPLLTRDKKTNTLTVNFDPILVKLLREVKYLYQLKIDVPIRASEIYANGNTYRTQINKLDQIVSMYNTVITSVNEVEEPLIIDKIKKMDKVLEPGISDLKWKSQNLNDFINKSQVIVEEVFKIINKMKEDLSKIQELLGEMDKTIVERKAKPVVPEEFYTTHQASVNQIFAKIKTNGNAISKIIKETNDLVKIDKKSKAWRNYQEYINDYIMDGIAQAIGTSLKTLNEFIDPNKKKDTVYYPWFEVSLTLIKSKICFSTEFSDSVNGASIRTIVNSVIKDILDIGISIQRIDSGGVGDYLVEIKDNFEVRMLLAKINFNLELSEKESNNYKDSFKDFQQYLAQDSKQFFENFLKNEKEVKVKVENTEGAQSPDEEVGDDLDKKNPLLKSIETKIPSFDKFDKMINSLKEVRSKVSGIKGHSEIGWIKINADPLKKSLDNILNDRIAVFINFLQSQVKAMLSNCSDFEKYLTEGIKADPRSNPEDKTMLMNVMEVLSKHRLVNSSIEKHFCFMKEMISLLKKHTQEAKDSKENKDKQDKSDDYIGMMEERQTKFGELFQQVILVKTNILTLQQRETEALKKRIDVFSQRVRQFRKQFFEKAPFEFKISISTTDVDAAYKTIDEYYQLLEGVKAEAIKFNELENLFELEQTKYKHLHECSLDIQRLKIMWDVIGRILYTYEFWRKTPWKSIRVDKYNPENEQFFNILKTLPREVKNFKSFGVIQELVSNMKRILNCIDMLSTEAMHNRHWDMLSVEIGAQIDQKSNSFCFEDIVKVNIHMYEAVVQETTENANKEQKIGKELDKINSIWSKLAFEFENFNQAGGELKIFKPFDSIQEILDNDTSKILSLLSQGKSVEVFKENLNDLKTKLNQVDTVMTIWGKVQKNWKRLVNIFLLSDDIRNQLQEATKLFDQKNAQFREIMTDVQLNPIIIEVCNDEKRVELEEISKSIEECEKKLNIYLEQKKKAFARFYFVSNQTLIDILSNGNNPLKIADEFLGDLFDGIKKLQMRDNPANKMACPQGIAMISKDAEVVPFKTPFEPKEEVEIWLSFLEAKMRDCLQDVMEDAKTCADEHFNSLEIKEECKMDWINKFCAQISLVTVQITWTDDVHKSFDDIEGGMSNAMKDCFEGIKKRINLLISKVRSPTLSKELRDKIITIITIDVHSRDVVEKLLLKNIVDKESFQWYSQLKFYWSKECSDVIANQAVRHPWEKNAEKAKCVIRIIDWAKFYSHEYVGNCGRLVITPLTDRCYITLTQALSLNMGGAPAGPAGTGKTETTKDLGRAVGLPVFVFNCSEQMNTDSLGQIFMGLSQTGAWGCFDEFNRISIEVLSVVSTQVKQVLDALREHKERFVFMDEEIGLQDTVGFFITMNPGYAGRTELPENLKALFRSCAMVVPDLILICENMLMSEGYNQARELAKKFVTLYDLSKSLLSKQKHYDWGLRAVKSVLRQAGKLKRQNETMSEELLLFGALKDFNMPKIVTDDKPIFINLLKDLFTEVEKVPETAIDEPLKAIVTKKAIELAYIPEEMFCLKCIQLSEILEVRHCVFIIGPTGSGKSAVWKTLAAANKDRGMETEFDCLDPKAVTSDELFGTLSKTKEFKNGVLSSIIKFQCKEMGKYKPHHKMKWAILDGDIDPEWIESLNTVMDDNKVLTLVSNDRFPLTPSMRLLFEISNLKYATPATVSRAGVLFINETDIGWKPFFDSWLESHKKETIEKQQKAGKGGNKIEFDPLAVSVFLKCQTYVDNPDIQKLIHVIPTCDMMMIETTTTIIDGLTVKNKAILDQKKEEELKIALEGIFLYAAMWGFGGTFLDSGEDEIYYKEFVRIWKSQAKIKYPEIQLGEGKIVSIFDFYFDVKSCSWLQYEVPIFAMPEDVSFTKLFVSTIYTQRLWDLIDLHVTQKKPIMFAGNAGTGKTHLINQFIFGLSPEMYLKNTVNFSSKTSSASLQENIVQSGLSKLGMRLWGLGSGRSLVFFVDDINMPYVDKYGTQSPIALMRQILDYGIVYDRDNLEEYNRLQDIYFCSCLNPKSGSFNIEPRLQRHFSTFCLPIPNEVIIKQIYRSILKCHFTQFDDSFSQMADKVVDSTVMLFSTLIKDTLFNPSAKKFHYQFNLRELSKVTEGVMQAQPASYKAKPNLVAKLWVHECKRVFQDRLVFDEDTKKFNEYLNKAYNFFVENHIKLTDSEKDDIFSESNIYTSFISIIEGESDKIYLPITSLEDLKAILVQKMEEYNETKAQMDLVLFNVALMHISRISRILDRSNGHGLLVGVGGSGKQSLTKLASFLQNYDLEPMPMMTNFNPNEFKQFIGDMLKKATKPPGTNRILMITDSQITSEDMLVFINDLLNNGYIPGLWPRDELEGHLQTMKNEARILGYNESPESLYSYFVEKIRKNIHLILCMSPVGDTLRIRARKFPGLINSTMINWFHGWPKDALYDVAYSFLKNVEFPAIENIIEKLSENMAETHIGIEDTNKKYLAQERRYNYTTPKSYLELIEFYKQKLNSKRKDIDNEIYSLQNGLNTLEETQNKVKGLEEELRIIMLEVEKKKKETNELIEKVNVEKEIANKEQFKANEEEAKTTELATAANEIKEKAEKAFLLAKPKLENAQDALQKLSEQKISIMKNLKSPPIPVVLTGKVIIYMFKGEKVDLFSDKDNESSWKKAVNVMNNVKRFLIDLKAFSNETAKNLDHNIKENVKKLIASGNFNVNDITESSSAAGNLADWAHNIIEFNEAFNIVKPLEEEKNKAEEIVRVKNKELEIVKEKVRLLVEKVATLEKKLQEAEEQERKVETERATYQRKLDASEKLVKGLSGENKRWSHSVEFLKTQKLTVIGDTLLAAEFVSYIAPFTSNFRYNLWHNCWIPDIINRKIPITEGITPLQILTKNSEMAKWKNQGLPEDEMSLQNATIITNCARWPLMIDPQLQGTNWLKGHYLELQSVNDGKKKSDDKQEDEQNKDLSHEFLRFSMNNKNSMAQLQLAISYGKKVLIENVAEEIDSILEPLLSRNITKKSTTYYITIGADQIEYSHKFRLYLQCKLQNPHFKPEIAAQCTIINFIVTEKGLEDQLLAMVVNFERQELETKRQELVRQQNDFEVKLSMLEETLLESLSSANPETILDNTELIDNLDNMKKMSLTIETQKEEGKITEKRINEEREKYRLVAAEGSMLFFLIISLVIVDHMYQYSLESFTTFFFKAMRGTTTDDDSRVKELVLNIRYIIYQWIARGLFERHKIIFLSMLTFRLMQKQIIKIDSNPQMMSFLLNCVPKPDSENPLKDWLPNSAWFAVQRLSEIDEFKKLPESMEKELPARFKDWFNELAPENSRLPSEWRKLDSQPFLKLCVIRALRPDRMTVALVQFIKSVLPRGNDFVSMDQNLSFNEVLVSAIEDATMETSMNTPIFFILSTGADPVKEVEKIGKKMKFEYNLNNFFNIALGQGQDKYADSKLEAGFRDGYWVMLQNIHLMPSWLSSLEKKLDQFAKEDGCHPNFRLFLSAEPNKCVPVGILERSIKLTNEPPAGLKANMKRAWTYFPKDEIDEKDTKYNHILFALCYFHSVLIERRKFGSKGWNMFYPFSIGDLRDSYSVLCKNAEVNTSGKIPWADLKYIFGEIMYGGHIVDDWDRKLCNGYLEYLLEPGLVSEDFELYPFVEGKRNSLKVPPTNSKFQRYLEQIESEITEETPIAYGLHPNAEIGLGISQCNYIFSSLIDLLPKDNTTKSDDGAAVPKNLEFYFNKIFNDYALKEKIFNIVDIKDRIVEKGAFQNVFLQECEYMNYLLEEICRSMTELDQGLKGILTISEKMENLLDALNLEKIPEMWQKLAYPAKRSLASWLENLMKRIEQLSIWKDDPMNIPRVTKVNMLFNPQSFFTAIKQYSKKGDLNKLTISTEFTKKTVEEIDGVVPKDGAYCYGFLLEGARWDWQLGVVEDSRPKEMFSVMPVCFCRAVFIPPPGREEKNVYSCPVYRTEDRGATFIFTAQLKTSPKNPPRKWILAGVAVILDVEDISDEAKKDTTAKTT